MTNYYIKGFFKALAMSFALGMNYREIYIEGIFKSDLFFHRLWNCFEGRELIISLLLIAIFCTIVSTKKVIYSSSLYFIVLSAFLALSYAAGIFFLDNCPIFSSCVQIIKYGIAIIGSYFFYRMVIQFVIEAITFDKKNSLKNNLSYHLYSHRIFYSFIYFILCWIIPLLLKYPAGICWDSCYQIDQGMGNVPLTAHHPVFHTMLMAWFTKVGIAIGSANIGIFGFVILETLIFIIVLCYGIQTLIKINTPGYLLALVYVFFGFSPFVTGYIGQVIKDLYFSIFIVLLTVILIKYVFMHNEFWEKKTTLVLFILACVSLNLFRNNGTFIIAPLIILMFCFEIKLEKKFNYKKIGILVLTLLLSVGSVKCINFYYGAEKGSVAEALSLPFQQTARFVKYHEDKVLEEEKVVIDKILPYDQLAIEYDPYISDPIKGKMKANITLEDLCSYFKVWFKQFFRMPVCYINSVWQQNIFLFYPCRSNYIYYLNTNPSLYEYKNYDYFNTPEKLLRLQIDYYDFLITLHSIPLLYIINNMSTYTILLLILICLILDRKQYKFLFCVVPAAVSFLIILAGPCIWEHVRYALPIIYTIPILFCAFSVVLRGKKAIIENEELDKNVYAS